MDIPLVATNDSHYLEQRDAPAHDVLLCIGTGKTVADTNRMKFSSDEFYVKIAEEMRELFADVPDACDNTRRDRRPHRHQDSREDLPSARLSGAASAAATPRSRLDRGAADGVGARRRCPVERAAESICGCLRTGLIERYGASARDDAALRERLDYELGVITKMGFASYFLIVWDFIKYARDHDIPVGPGRGSAVGSVVSYCLRITDLDPIKFKLIFERFLNPDRISMPDIDTDFCVERRDEVIDYVTEKYGKDRVAQIVTFGTMAARAAIRDAGRALGVPLPDVDRVAKLIPSGPGGLTIDAGARADPRAEVALRRQPADPQAARHGQSDRRAGAPRRDARGGRRDLEGPADRLRAAGASSATATSTRSTTWNGSRTSACSRWTSWACAT